VLLKRRTNSLVQSLIEPIRARRRELEEDPAEMLAILRRGTMRAREVAGETLSELKSALGLTYFQS
jgi:tryptophanyl-tRNA synthetase